MLPDLIHAGAVIAFGGFAGSYWAGLQASRRGALWAAIAVFFLLVTAFAGGYNG